MSFNCINFFLTYPRCAIDKDVLLDHLFNLSTPRGVPLQTVYARVCKETHQDGTPHLHALLCLDKRYRASKNFFDFLGHHPNVQGARSITSVKDYLAKEGDYVERGETPNTSRKRNYGDIVKESTNEADFLEAVLAEHPRDAVLHHDRLLTFARYRYRTPTPIYTPTFTTFTSIPPELDEWFSTNIMGPHQQGVRRKSLILTSPTRYGKTQWARSLGPHIYFNSMFDLANFCSDVSFAIFDDFKWESFSTFHKQWLGCQEEFTLTDKYRKKQTVQWGKPCIYLCNPEDMPSMTSWLQENCVYIYLNKPLYN